MRDQDQTRSVQRRDASTGPAPRHPREHDRRSRVSGPAVNVHAVERFASAAAAAAPRP